MADKDFDFKALGEKKLVEYKKQDCKPMMVKKAKAALIMIDFRLKGKKTPCVLVPFKKPGDALKAFKKLKKEKAHIVKKTGLCKISVGAGADGKDEITIDIKKGGLSPEVLEKKGVDLFGGYLKMALNVVGSGETVDDQEDENDEDQDDEDQDYEDDNDQDYEDDDDDDDDDDSAEKEINKTKRSAKVSKMNENVGKMDGVVGKMDASKLTGNVEKYEAALAQLIKEAEADGEIDAEEQASIDELTSNLNALKENIAKQETGGDGKSTPKMTPERKVKLNENMDKIKARLEAMTKSLGIS